MMRKGTILFLILALILSCFPVVSSAAGASDVMSNFSILPASCSVDSDSLVTRRDFAYTITNILINEEVDPRDTEFVDVSAEDEDSGYIYYATVNGFLPSEGNLFLPNDPISFHDFNAAVIKLLSYETIANVNGGGEEGNLKTVNALRLYRDVEVKTYDTVTVKQFRQMIYNLLTADIAAYNYTYDAYGNVNMENTGDKKTILSQYFGVSRYYGSIVEVNHQSQMAKVNITKNVSETNPELLTVGTNYDFATNGKIDLNFYRNIPVEIWTDRNGMMIYIAPQKNVEVFYDVIYSVNNDTNADNAYALHLVDEIELNRDEKEYKIAEGATVSYNGELTRTPVKLAGKYAKIVLINNKVTFIETWNLEEAGMVTEVNNSYISYLKGESVGRVKRIGEYDDIMVIIGGRSTDRTQIKPGSLFYYYQSDDLLVVVVSEKTVVGNFSSLADDEIEIGNRFYPITDNDGDGAAEIYASENGEDYTQDNLERFYDNEVICYVDIFDNIRYIARSGDLQAKNEFTAYIIGSFQKGFDDIKIKVQKIYPEVAEETIILPTDIIGSSKIVEHAQRVFSTKESIAAAALHWEDIIIDPFDIHRMNAADGLYKFTINADGEITRIADPDFYLFYGEEHEVSYLDTATKEELVAVIPRLPAKDVPLDHFVGDFRGVYFPISHTGGIGALNSTFSRFNIHNERFIVLSNKGGKMHVEEVSYDTLLAHGPFTDQNGMRVNVAMFAEPGTSHPQFWFLYGNTDKIYRHQGDEDSVIDSVTEKYNAEDDERYYEVILDNGDTKWTLDSIAIKPEWIPESYDETVSGPFPATLEEGMRVYYMSGALFCDNGIYITSVEAVAESEVMEDWYEQLGYDLNKGVVKKITSYRMFLENGGAYHLGTNCRIVGIKIKNGKIEQVNLSAADIAAGTTVYYGGLTNINYIAVEYVD